MSKHTPGPWNIVYDNWGPTCISVNSPDPSVCIFTQKNDYERAKFTDSDGGYGVPRTRANANLIAAAPELLAALKELNDNAEQAIQFLPHILLERAITKARWAIKKAEGEQ